MMTSTPELPISRECKELQIVGVQSPQIK